MMMMMMMITFIEYKVYTLHICTVHLSCCDPDSSTSFTKWIEQASVWAIYI